MNFIERTLQQAKKKKEQLNERRLALWKIKNKEYQKPKPNTELCNDLAQLIPMVAAEQHKLHQLIMFIEHREKMNWKLTK